MKKILYIHGFGSSAQTATVGRLRNNLPECETHAIDVTHHPVPSIRAIEDYVKAHNIDLLIGTSLGGYYTLCSDVDIPKVAVNPAINPAKTLVYAVPYGINEYFNPRLDGVNTFDFQPEHMKEFQGIAMHITESTYIIASDHDEILGDSSAAYRDLVGCERFTLTKQVGHRMNDEFVQRGSGDLYHLLQKILNIK